MGYTDKASAGWFFKRKAPAAKWSRALDEVPFAVWRGAWLLGLGNQQRVAKLDERVAADKRSGAGIAVYAHLPHT